MLGRTWCLFLLCCVARTRGQMAERGLPPASPCPNVYGYGWDPAGGWHGIITILPPARFSEAQLVFRMTVPYYRPEAGVGRVEVKGGTAEIQAISRRAFRGESHKIQFMIIFPPFDDIPRVKEVIINGKNFCHDMRVYPETRSTIELKYVLRTGVTMPVASGNDFSIVTNNNNNNHNHNRPSKPDLVTVAILVPWDEARPIGSSPQAPSQPIGPGPQPPRPMGSAPQLSNPTEFSPQTPSRPIGVDVQKPSRPIGSGFQSPRPIADGSQLPVRPITSSDASNSASKHPCKCNKTSSVSNNEIKEKPDFSSSNETPEHHVFHTFEPPKPGGSMHVEHTEDLYDIFTSTTPSVPHPGGSSGHDVTNGNHHLTSRPVSSVFRPGVPGSNTHPNGNTHHETSNASGSHRPVAASSGNGNHFNNNNFGPTTEKPTVGVSNHREPVDDKIYFIMTESDDANSPRIVKLLEHLLVVAKKRYHVDLQRLEIEKKRLALETSPHYTIVL